jgi:hypothetical protein
MHLPGSIEEILIGFSAAARRTPNAATTGGGEGGKNQMKFIAIESGAQFGSRHHQLRLRAKNHDKLLAASLNQFKIARFNSLSS